MPTTERVLVENRKARHEYEILETMEAGLLLTGTEIKSLRAGKGNLSDSYARVDKGEVWILHLHISPYEQGNRANVDPLRERKALLHKEEIRRLVGKTREKGLALIPLKIYLSHGRAKIELALARGKRQYDKREAIAEREAGRERERVLKHGQRDD
ncbi:MAG: SsrA-binding protein SmpB [Armatimonadota bacterium]